MFAPVSGFPVQNNHPTATLVINPGESVIVLLMDASQANSTLTLTDGTNTYAFLGSKSDTRDGFTTTLVASMNPTPGTYTLTLSGAGGDGGAFNISKYTGLTSFSAGSFESFFSGATPPTATDGCATSAIAPSAFPAMIFAASQVASGTILAAGTGFTSRFANSTAGDGGNGVYIEDLRLTSGSNIGSFTMTAGGSDVTVIGAAFTESAPPGAALVGPVNAVGSAGGSLTTGPAPFQQIMLDNPAHSGGSTQINMGTGPGTGTGDNLDVAFTKVKQDFADVNTMFSQLFPNRSTLTPTTGFSIAVATGVTQLVLSPVATLAAGTITLPQKPADNQPFVATTSNTITALTVNTSDGTTIAAAPTTLSNTGAIKLRFQQASNIWFREQ
jgi:hypothetical protein